ncbi:hypothetical protein Tco_1128101, partial [Tanacetum coccineum]
ITRFQTVMELDADMGVSSWRKPEL